MPTVPASTLPAPPRLRIDYVDAPLDVVLARADTLAVFGFGNDAPASLDPRYLRVPLQPDGRAPLEVWRGSGVVQHGAEGELRWADDGALRFGALELDEAEGGIEAASAAAYARLTHWLREHPDLHLLRVWNYLDAITDGDGDDERYRRFCVGRARSLGAFEPARLPAATAIGRVDGVRRLQLYWLAARQAGTPLENPRQLSAYRYPRQYGPQPPSFARAMLPPGDHMPLLLSGTASVVGHESRHPESLAAQLDETFANFASLLDAARQQRRSLPATFGPGTRLKVYVRDRDRLADVAAALDARLGPAVPRIVLHAAVCRRELQVEIDGSHAAA